MIAALSLFYYAFCVFIQYSRNYYDTKLSTPNRQLSTPNRQLSTPNSQLPTIYNNVLLFTNTAFS